MQTVTNPKVAKYKHEWFPHIKYLITGSSCASVGRAVASKTRDPWFDSSHWQSFITYIVIVNCLKRRK